MPKAELVWDGSTSTGTGPEAQFGIGVNHVTILIDNASTETFGGDVEGAMGRSRFATLHSISGGTTGVLLELATTGETVVDKVRLNLSSNATTGGLQVWAAGD